MPKDYLDTPLLYLPAIGEKKASLLAQEASLRTLRDLIYYFPYKYIDRSRIYRICELSSTEADVQLKGKILSYELEGAGRKSRLKAIFQDNTGEVELIWFTGAHYIPKSYPTGCEYILFGKPTVYKRTFSFSHPELTPAAQAKQVTGGLMGVYHTTAKMKRSFLDSRNLRKVIVSLLPMLQQYLTESLPKTMLQKLNMMALVDAIHIAHMPKDLNILSAAIERIKFDELFFLRLSMESTKKERQRRFVGYNFETVGQHFNTLYASLPYDLTGAQKRVIREIRQNTNQGFQMNRLLHGDVGSGKTIVAAFAMMLALDNGLQSCIMAPTEILATQHFETLNELFEPLGLQVALFTGSTPQKERDDIRERLREGSLNMLVGTHALIEEGVTFPRLGLAIIDEQHRFGVAQRAKLWAKSSSLLPHILIMSATPIPRTLAMTLYGDLDISVIDELPPGRKPISTFRIFDHEEEKVHKFIAERIIEGRQVYVVYPMIEGTEESDYKNLETGYKRFAHMFGEKNITYVHGKLPAKEKQKRMESFVHGEVPILLSTTVIEVGVNVPNATVMVIENANRFGLAQLHQLRGRVGRGAEKSYCILISPVDITFTGEKRLEIMTKTTDGFVIAEEDMKLRGEGDIEGTRQSGELPGLNLASPSQDSGLLRLAGYYAERLIDEDPDLSEPDVQCISEQLERILSHTERWGNIS